MRDSSLFVLRVVATGLLVLLIALCLAWELRLAPLRPGGSLLALKALPLVLPLYGIMRGWRYTYQWSSMLVIAYFVEGAMRAWGDRGLSQQLAMAEIAIAIALFAATVAYARLGRSVDLPTRRPQGV